MAEIVPAPFPGEISGLPAIYNGRPAWRRSLVLAPPISRRRRLGTGGRPSNTAMIETLQLREIAVRRACQKTIGTTADAESDTREGRFCAILFQAARKALILNGEMAEWLKAHAWKAIPASITKRYRHSSFRRRSNDLASRSAPRCDSVIVGISRRFQAHLTPFLHSASHRLRRRSPTRTGEYLPCKEFERLRDDVRVEHRDDIDRRVAEVRRSREGTRAHAVPEPRRAPLAL